MTRQVTADIAASVVRVIVAVGDRVRVDQPLVVLESMKMEIPVLAGAAGRVTVVGVAAGDTVLEGDLLVTIEPQRDEPDAVGGCA
jgi:acetyl-CoA carboxylase biotin carboxyl carrier protein